MSSSSEIWGFSHSCAFQSENDDAIQVRWLGGWWLLLAEDHCFHFSCPICLRWASRRCSVQFVVQEKLAIRRYLEALAMTRVFAFALCKLSWICSVKCHLNAALLWWGKTGFFFLCPCDLELALSLDSFLLFSLSALLPAANNQTVLLLLFPQHQAKHHIPMPHLSTNSDHSNYHSMLQAYMQRESWVLWPTLHGLLLPCLEWLERCKNESEKVEFFFQLILVAICIHNSVGQ